MTSKPIVESAVIRAQQILRRDSAAIADQADKIGPDFIAVANVILECSGHVLVAGAGTSASTAGRFAHLLSCCGTPALFIHPGDCRHGLIGAITNQDILVALSKGGDTEEVNTLVRAAKQRRAKVVAITAVSDAPLAQLADVTLLVAVPQEADPFGMIATCSSLVLASICNALSEIVMAAKGYREEQFWKTHPGGAVGTEISARRRNDSALSDIPEG